MKTGTIQRVARVAVRGRKSGWADWWLTDSLGCVLKHPTLTMNGMEPSKVKARAVAVEAARDFNRDYQAHPPVSKAIAYSEIKPSCDRREVFNHQ